LGKIHVAGRIIDWMWYGGATFARIVVMAQRWPIARQYNP